MLDTDPPSQSDEHLDTVAFDLDGTLVDSVYQHTVAWKVAFVDVGMHPPAWRIHRAIGMGGDRLVTEVAGAAVERAVGDRVRMLHGRHFEAALREVTVLPGASELLDELFHRGLKVVVASSGGQEVTDRLLDLIDNRGILEAWTSGSGGTQSKPAPDLFDAAIRRVNGNHAIVIGDSIWDAKAAIAGGRGCLGLLTGGTSAEELRAAGAGQVFESPADLLEHLDQTPLR